MTLFDWFVSLWRTVVPTIVGFVATTLASIYIDVDEKNLTNALVVGFIAVYYGIFRFLEVHADKRWGWFLGFARPPQYPQPAPPTPPAGT